ncbi:hypothetical protein [Serratia silvae]
MSEGQGEDWRTQIDFAAAISATPPQANVAQLVALREQGLGEPYDD